MRMYASQINWLTTSCQTNQQMALFSKYLMKKGTHAQTRPANTWWWLFNCTSKLYADYASIVLQLIVAAGMGPILALKYFRFTYRPSKINTLQQAERMGGPILSIGSIEPQSRSLEKDVSTLSITLPKNRNPVYEPLLSDSPNTRRSFGSGTPFEFFQSPSRLSSSYARNCKDNWLIQFIYQQVIFQVMQ